MRSVEPLVAYLHSEGLARFCTDDYEPPAEANLANAFAHLTNYSLNKHSKAYVHPQPDLADPADLQIDGGGADGGGSGAAGSDAAGGVDSDVVGTNGRRASTSAEATCAATATHDGEVSAAPAAQTTREASDFLAQLVSTSREYAAGRELRSAGCSKRPASDVINELVRLSRPPTPPIAQPSPLPLPSPPPRHSRNPRHSYSTSLATLHHSSWCAPPLSAAASLA